MLRKREFGEKCGGKERDGVGGAANASAGNCAAPVPGCLPSPDSLQGCPNPCPIEREGDHRMKTEGERERVIEGWRDRKSTRLNSSH